MRGISGRGSTGKKKKKKSERQRPAELVPLFNHIVEHLHHGHRLLLRKALPLEPLDKLERVKVVVALSACRRVQRPRQNRAWAWSGCAWTTRGTLAVEPSHRHRRRDGAVVLRSRAGQPCGDASCRQSCGPAQPGQQISWQHARSHCTKSVPCLRSASRMMLKVRNVFGHGKGWLAVDWLRWRPRARAEAQLPGTRLLSS